MIEVRNVHKAFEGKQVLHGVDLAICKGESCVIIGGSGAGKSVLMKCILGLMEPDSGQITINNQRRDASFKDKVGMLFQGAALFDSLPVWQNVAFKHLRHLPKSEAKALAIDKLTRVGLDAQTADLYPADLSGGMQKRVGLARAIATDPEVIFFDEPTTGLDPIMANVINRLIRDIVTDLDVTAVTITHDMTSVQAIADKVAMLHAGQIHWTGTQAEMSVSQNPALNQFISGRAEGPIPSIS